MSILLLTVRGDPYPFSRSLYCTASAAICEFGFVGTERSSIEVSRCLLADASDQLDLALARLLGNVPHLPQPRGAADLWSAQLAWLDDDADRPKAYAEFLHEVRPEWEHVVLPIPGTTSLHFVATAEPPTAVRSYVTVEAHGNGWIVSYLPTFGQHAATRCSTRQVVPRLRELLSTLAECGHRVPDSGTRWADDRRQPGE